MSVLALAPKWGDEQSWGPFQQFGAVPAALGQGKEAARLEQPAVESLLW